MQIRHIFKVDVYLNILVLLAYFQSNRQYNLWAFAFEKKQDLFIQWHLKHQIVPFRKTAAFYRRISYLAQEESNTAVSKAKTVPKKKIELAFVLNLNSHPSSWTKRYRGNTTCFPLGRYPVRRVPGSIGLQPSNKSNLLSELSFLLYIIPFDQTSC
jgi:hypothetical protein